MSVADRMVVRTRDGEYRSVPRRTALAMISVGRAQAAGTTTIPDEGETPTVVADVASVVPENVSEPATTEPEPVLEPVGVNEPAPEYEIPTVEAVPLPAEPRANASRGKWLEYAVSLGVEVADDLTRNEIRDAAQRAAQSLSDLPQPAVTDGGRLDMPEDEPVTEESVTDDEDSGTR